MPNPDLSLITTAFVEMGGPVFGKMVLDWDLRSDGVQVRTNVTKPQAMTKLSAVGGPRPYRSQDDTSGNGVKYTDRTLTVYPSKWDHDFDPQEYRNTYLAEGLKNMSFAQAATNQLAAEYLEAIKLNTLWFGVRNGSGDGVEDICDGWGTMIAAEITGFHLTPIATGEITVSNAVDALEYMVENANIRLRGKNKKIILYTPYHIFDKYTKNYRTLNGYGFQKDVLGDYKLDNKNAIIRPVDWIPQTSGRVALTVENNFVFGTDVESVEVAASMRRNIIESRPMMAAGCQIQDLDALAVNDQA